jgi:hypothetical protein
LGTYVWPNQYVFNTYQEEVNFLKQWITDRVEWMDSNMPGSGPCNPITGVDPAFEKGFAVYPNPSASTFYFKLPETQQRYVIAVYNTLGECVFSSENSTDETVMWNAKDKNGVPVSAGLYTVVIQYKSSVFTTKIIKQ